MASDNPYKLLPPRAFWRSAVAEPGMLGLSDLWKSKWKLPADARFSTFGSCFAQHISRALIARRLNWFEAEPAPSRTPIELAQRFNYGIFSARTGNIYTAAQLLLWTRLARGLVDPAKIELWTDAGGRVHDTLRPQIEPGGFASADEAQASIATTARAFLRSFAEAEVFIFTLGLTEGWMNSHSGQVYPLCPGTGVGVFDPDLHVFRNYSYPEIRADLEEAFELMRVANPGLRLLLTVSPVPLVASASGDHVLVATTYSKSTLRAVAGDLAAQNPAIDYFPSYEIISAPPGRAMFFEPNLRGIATQGVNFVMTHVFSGLDLSGASVRAGAEIEMSAQELALAKMAAEDIVCEEMTLERFNVA